jgi:hypothetical protein
MNMHGPAAGTRAPDVGAGRAVRVAIRAARVAVWGGVLPDQALVGGVPQPALVRMRRLERRREQNPVGFRVGLAAVRGRRVGVAGCVGHAPQRRQWGGAAPDSGGPPGEPAPRRRAARAQANRAPAAGAAPV